MKENHDSIPTTTTFNLVYHFNLPYGRTQLYTYIPFIYNIYIYTHIRIVKLYTTVGLQICLLTGLLPLPLLCYCHICSCSSLCGSQPASPPYVATCCMTAHAAWQRLFPPLSLLLSYVYIFLLQLHAVTKQNAAFKLICTPLAQLTNYV